MQGLLITFSETAYAAGMLWPDLQMVVRRQYLITALKSNNLNQMKTAIRLGVHRNTVSRSLSELKINIAILREEMRQEKKRAASDKPSVVAASNVG